MIETSTSSFEPLLIACREACDAMSTLVRAVYESEEFGVERKSKDGSAFTLADGLVQALLVRLLNETIGQILGEEESGALVQLDTPPPFRAVCAHLKTHARTHAKAHPKCVQTHLKAHHEAHVQTALN